VDVGKRVIKKGYALRPKLKSINGTQKAVKNPQTGLALMAEVRRLTSLLVSAKQDKKKGKEDREEKVRRNSRKEMHGSQPCRKSGGQRKGLSFFQERKRAE